MKSTGGIPTVRLANVTAYTDKEKADVFSSFFATTFSGPQRLPDYHDMPISSDIDHFIADFDTSPRTIGSFLQQLDVSKSRGIDELPPVLFKRPPTVSRNPSV